MLSIPHRSGRFEHLLRSGTDAKVFGQISPAHRAAPVDKKLSRSRDFLTVNTRAFVLEVVPTRDFSVLIRQKHEGVSRLVAMLARYFRRIDTDGNGADPQRFEVAETRLDTP